MSRTRQRILILALLMLALSSVALAAGNIESNGNIYLVGGRPFISPIKMYLGPDYDRGLYIFEQERPDGSLFAGMETFQRPAQGAPVAEGYGAYPLRLWGSNVLIEENGVLVVREVVANKIILQQPDTTVGGAIRWNPDDMGTYLTRDGPDVILYNGGREVARWR